MEDVKRWSQKRRGGKWEVYSAPKHRFSSLSQMFLPWYNLASEILSQKKTQACLLHLLSD